MRTEDTARNRGDSRTKQGRQRQPTRTHHETTRASKVGTKTICATRTKQQGQKLRGYVDEETLSGRNKRNRGHRMSSPG